MINIPNEINQSNYEFCTDSLNILTTNAFVICNQAQQWML